MTEDPTPLVENQSYPDFEEDHQPPWLATPTPGNDQKHTNDIADAMSSSDRTDKNRNMDASLATPITDTSSKWNEPKISVGDSADAYKLKPVNDVSRFTITKTPVQKIENEDADKMASKPSPASISTKPSVEVEVTHLETQNNVKNTEKSNLANRDKVLSTTISTTVTPATNHQAVVPPTIKTSEDQERSRMELQPLILKKNYDNSKLLSKKDRTPGQTTPGHHHDLLDWCKDVTKSYSGIEVIDLTTSWRNGMAFCAIIHHFEPELM